MSDALTRFRAASQAAVERGRRAARDARETGERFEKETQRLTEQQRGRDHKPSPDDRATPADLRTAAAAYRSAAGLPVPEFPVDSEPQPAPPAVEPEHTAEIERDEPDDDDFSQEKIMYRL